MKPRNTRHFKLRRRRRKKLPNEAQAPKKGFCANFNAWLLERRFKRCSHEKRLLIARDLWKLDVNWDSKLKKKKWEGVKFVKNEFERDKVAALMLPTMELKTMIPIYGSNLSKLLLEGNPSLEMNISSFQNCQKLVHLNLAHSRAQGDISVFEHCNVLLHLDLQSTKIQGNVSVFYRAPQLKTLNLNNTLIEGDVKVFSRCPNISDISLNRTLVFGDLSVFETCTDLKYISLRQTAVSGVLSLKMITMIADLRDEFGCDAVDLVECGNLTLATDKGKKLQNGHRALFIDLRRLTSLEGDISVFSKCIKLQHLYLAETGLTGKISSLKQCLDLEYVDLCGTSLSGNLSSFDGFSNLKSVEYDGCPAIKGEAYIHKKSWQAALMGNESENEEEEYIPIVEPDPLVKKKKKAPKIVQPSYSEIIFGVCNETKPLRSNK